MATLQQAATDCWNNYLLGQGDSDLKCWAAAELWRLDQSVTSARDYVEGYMPNSWSGFWPYGYHATFHAALAYMETPGANSTIVNNMMNGFSGCVNQHFDARGPYRDSMFDWAYHWGSNKCRGSWGVLMTEAARLGATGSHSAAECMDLAQDYLHAFHGQNPMRMVYLTNMWAYGGEHSSVQFFHSWFGAITDPESVAWYRGLPPGVTEPDYPYFKGTDNYGVSDDNYSDYGPVPGLVPGGPNKDYSGLANPPKGSTYYELFYRDWIDNSPDGWYRTKVWEVNENSIAYQGPYVALVAGFMTAGEPPPPPDTDPPAAPTGLTGTAVSSSQIDLDWDDNSENDLDSYRLYRSTTSGGPYDLVIADLVVSACSDTGLAESTTYYYVVTAVDTSGNESDNSNEANATTESTEGTMHVSQISHGGQNGPLCKRGRWVDIYIVDWTGAPVQGATVYATAEGWDDCTQSNIIENFSGDTGSGGSLRFVTMVDAGNICVTDVTHSTLIYDSGQNEVTCGYW